MAAAANVPPPSSQQCSAHPSLRSDILVHSENVSRIIFRLDLGEPCKVSAVCPRKTLGFVFREEVHILCARCVGTCRVVEFPRPTDAASIVLGVLPAGVNVHEEVSVSPRKSRCVGGHAPHGASEVCHENLALRRRQPSGKLCN